MLYAFSRSLAADKRTRNAAQTAALGGNTYIPHQPRSELTYAPLEWGMQLVHPEPILFHATTELRR